ncbi:hypothetical protein PHAVU_002G070900 [Phaseolus vulgaris]|uniref:non-specific serine/threonine protein kinase n=1 Tax=Phaseolus vulgaris TaxID=3885 RepID=V7CKK2_PHAVU|nr:hypothetical protein PHAVU_002G070900g [Phaseolus vulgaris]ESW29441.1 hypothetical protein PHAVU_002G070900g [Phaseolus vulgaris]
MADESSSNGSSVSDSISAPLSSSSLQASDAESSVPSNPPPPSPSSPLSSPPPAENSSPPPTTPPPASENSPPPPTPSNSPPPTPSTSPPPAPSTSPPPTPSTSPPPSPSPSPPAPVEFSPPPTLSPPPPLTNPPSEGLNPPPSLSPPPPSEPLPSSPPPQNSPPLPQSSDPPPQPLSPPTVTTTQPSPASLISPPPLQTASASKPPSQLRSTPRLTPTFKPKQKSAPPKSHPPTASPSSSGNSNTGEVVGLALAGVFIVGFIALVIFFIFRNKNKRANIYAVPPPRKSHMRGAGAAGDVLYYVEEPGFGNGAQQGGMPIKSPSDPALSGGQLVFSYEKIAEITNGFSSENIIGEGGFGYVYKASMPDGRVGALKILKAGSGQGEREFRSEVDIISRIHHRHLVSLIGYCISEQQRVLIYEFVPNGNLNQHLHGSELPILDWSNRLKIAIGSARGLSYLHDGCNPKIIHRDIKSANILLDNAYEAQVADFGLARLTDDANTHVSTRVMGTFGYMAPEYATSGKLTDKSDIFSFGVVLLELITGRKPVDPMQPLGQESLVEWARPLLLHAVQTGDFGQLVDLRLQQQYNENEMFKMIEAAAACVRHSAPKRPSMVQVIRALDNGDQLHDLSNGVRYGQSTIYNSGQYNEDIARFRKMVNPSFDDSEFDNNSSEFRSTVSRGTTESNPARMLDSAATK